MIYFVDCDRTILLTSTRISGNIGLGAFRHLAAELNERRMDPQYLPAAAEVADDLVILTNHGAYKIPKPYATQNGEKVIYVGHHGEILRIPIEAVYYYAWYASSDEPYESLIEAKHFPIYRKDVVSIKGVRSKSENKENKDDASEVVW